MDFKAYEIYRMLTIVMLLTYLRLAASTNIDCGGKPFHCVNSTHFMICVDLGAGVTKTVDDFYIQCPPTTSCHVSNHFECEFRLSTTTEPTTHLGDATNDLKIDIQTTTTSWNDIIHTVIPLKKTSTSKLFNEYLNTIEMSTPGDYKLHVQKSEEKQIVDIAEGITNINNKTPVRNESFNILTTSSKPYIVVNSTYITSSHHNTISESAVSKISFEPNITDNIIKNIDISNRNNSEYLNSVVYPLTSEIVKTDASTVTTTPEIVPTDLIMKIEISDSNGISSRFEKKDELASEFELMGVNKTKDNRMTSYPYETITSDVSERHSTKDAKRQYISMVENITATSDLVLDNIIQDNIIQDVPESTTYLQFNVEDVEKILPETSNMLDVMPTTIMENYYHDTSVTTEYQPTTSLLEQITFPNNIHTLNEETRNPSINTSLLLYNDISPTLPSLNISDTVITLTGQMMYGKNGKVAGNEYSKAQLTTLGKTFKDVEIDSTVFNNIQNIDAYNVTTTETTLTSTLDNDLLTYNVTSRPNVINATVQNIQKTEIEISHILVSESIDKKIPFYEENTVQGISSKVTENPYSSDSSLNIENRTSLLDLTMMKQLNQSKTSSTLSPHDQSTISSNISKINMNTPNSLDKPKLLLSKVNLITPFKPLLFEPAATSVKHGINIKDENQRSSKDVKLQEKNMMFTSNARSATTERSTITRFGNDNLINETMTTIILDSGTADKNLPFYEENTLQVTPSEVTGNTYSGGSSLKMENRTTTTIKYVTGFKDDVQSTGNDVKFQDENIIFTSTKISDTTETSTPTSFDNNNLINDSMTTITSILVHETTDNKIPFHEENALQVTPSKVTGITYSGGSSLKMENRTTTTIKYVTGFKDDVQSTGNDMKFQEENIIFTSTKISDTTETSTPTTFHNNNLINDSMITFTSILVNETTLKKIPFYGENILQLTPSKVTENPYSGSSFLNIDNRSLIIEPILMKQLNQSKTSSTLSPHNQSTISSNISTINMNTPNSLDKPKVLLSKNNLTTPFKPLLFEPPPTSVKYGTNIKDENQRTSKDVKFQEKNMMFTSNARSATTEMSTITRFGNDNLINETMTPIILDSGTTDKNLPFYEENTLQVTPSKVTGNNYSGGSSLKMKNRTTTAIMYVTGFKDNIQSTDNDMKFQEENIIFTSTKISDTTEMSTPTIFDNSLINDSMTTVTSILVSETTDKEIPFYEENNLRVTSSKVSGNTYSGGSSLKMENRKSPLELTLMEQLKYNKKSATLAYYDRSTVSSNIHDPLSTVNVNTSNSFEKRKLLLSKENFTTLYIPLSLDPAITSINYETSIKDENQSTGNDMKFQEENIIFTSTKILDTTEMSTQTSFDNNNLINHSMTTFTSTLVSENTDKKLPFYEQNTLQVTPSKVTGNPYSGSRSLNIENRTLTFESSLIEQLKQNKKSSTLAHHDQATIHSNIFTSSVNTPNPFDNPKLLSSTENFTTMYTPLPIEPAATSKYITNMNDDIQSNSNDLKIQEKNFKFTSTEISATTEMSKTPRFDNDKVIKESLTTTDPLSQETLQMPPIIKTGDDYYNNVFAKHENKTISSKANLMAMVTSEIDTTTITDKSNSVVKTGLKLSKDHFILLSPLPYSEHPAAPINDMTKSTTISSSDDVAENDIYLLQYARKMPSKEAVTDSAIRNNYKDDVTLKTTTINIINNNNKTLIEDDKYLINIKDVDTLIVTDTIYNSRTSVEPESIPVTTSTSTLEFGKQVNVPNNNFKNLTKDSRPILDRQGNSINWPDFVHTSTEKETIAGNNTSKLNLITVNPEYTPLEPVETTEYMPMTFGNSDYSNSMYTSVQYKERNEEVLKKRNNINIDQVVSEPKIDDIYTDRYGSKSAVDNKQILNNLNISLEGMAKNLAAIIFSNKTEHNYTAVTATSNDGSVDLINKKSNDTSEHIPIYYSYKNNSARDNHTLNNSGKIYKPDTIVEKTKLIEVLKSRGLAKITSVPTSNISVISETVTKVPCCIPSLSAPIELNESKSENVSKTNNLSSNQLITNNNERIFNKSSLLANIEATLYNTNIKMENSSNIYIDHLKKLNNKTNLPVEVDSEYTTQNILSTSTNNHQIKSNLQISIGGVSDIMKNNRTYRKISSGLYTPNNVKNNDKNQNNLYIQQFIHTTTLPKANLLNRNLAITANFGIKVNENKINMTLFTCKNRLRGRYSDKNDCRKFYICFGILQPVHGECPANTVFSDIKKQCTKNLGHCIRDNQFRCIQEGRFSDVLRTNIYYICVKAKSKYIRFQFQCQNDYYLNKTSVKCVTTNMKFRSQVISTSIDNDSKKESSSYSTFEKISTETKRIKDTGSPICREEGKFPDVNDCRRYYVCSKNSKSIYRRKTKKCDSDEVFHRERKKCVDSDSYECK